MVKLIYPHRCSFKWQTPYHLYLVSVKATCRVKRFVTCAGRAEPGAGQGAAGAGAPDQH